MTGDEALVLAAGKGTRMRSNLPKVLHPLAGKPMLVRVLDALRAGGFPCPTAVVGYGAEAIEAAVGDRCRYAIQTEQRGTGHAALVGLDALPSTVRRVLLVHGDEPLIGPDLFRQMLEEQERTGASVVLLTTHVADTRGFGRVIRGAAGYPVALVQESDLTPEERAVDEVNLGAYVFDADFLRASLGHLQPHPPKDEYYLTDLIAVAAGRSTDAPGVVAVTVPNGAEMMGINDLVHLEQATRVIYGQTNRRLMESGVTILDSASTFIDEEVHVEPDTVIYPFTMISGATHIGEACRIGPGAHILSSHIGERCRIVSSTVEMAHVGDDVSIGPYAHLRSGARVGSGAEIGNYAEIKKSTIGPGTKMHHFSYLGDAQVGANVNIGAGAITCNFDGVDKHQTVIEDGAFIGSDTLLRAPVTIGTGAFTGAGSVVTRDVPPGKVVAGMPARVIKSVSKRDTSETDGEVHHSGSHARREC